jgi:RecA/RadA recombinase
VVGRIVDVLVGDAGLPRAAVIDFGGFLGVGNRRVAVTWSSLSFNAAARTIALDMTADQIRATPQFRLPDKPADPPISVAVPPDPKAPPASR